MKSAKTLIVEPLPLMRLGLSYLLRVEAGLEVCAEAGDLASAEELFIAHQPELVVMDIHLPEGDGIMLIKDLRRRAPGTLFLVVTFQEDVATVQRALRAGARGYVIKHDDLREILEALHSMQKGGRYVSRSVASKFADTFANGGVKTAATELGALSDREMQVFRLIGDGLGSKEIAHQLHISTKTVETHRQRMKDKLACGTSSQLRHRAEVWHLEHDDSDKPARRARGALRR